MLWELKIWSIGLVTDICLLIINKINPYKDRCLSQRLFDLAEDYNTRPGTNNYCVEGDGDDNHAKDH